MSGDFLDDTMNRWREQRNKQRDAVEESPVLGRLGAFAGALMGTTTGAPFAPVSSGTSSASGVSICSTGEKVKDIPVSRHAGLSGLFSAEYWKNVAAHVAIGSGCDDGGHEYDNSNNLFRF